MLASVLIPNHNYARYVALALDSALNQTYPHVEVVVVDDGSTDESRKVIRSYGDQIVSSFKPQEGQAAALNDAFALSSGQLICLLDADDVFLPTKIERVVSAWRACPAACLIHHQLQAIDADGRLLHRPFPRRILHGDLERRVVRSGGWFAHAPSGALSFPRSYAERLFPVPAHWQEGSSARGAHLVRVEVDTYLAGPAAVLAPVAGIRAPLTHYRLHGANTHLSAIVGAERIARFELETKVMQETLHERFGKEVDLRMEDHLEWQLVRSAAGEISRAQAVRAVIKSPGLPASMKPREALRVLANRGLASRAKRGSES